MNLIGVLTLGVEAPLEGAKFNTFGVSVFVRIVCGRWLGPPGMI